MVPVVCIIEGFHYSTAGVHEWAPDYTVIVQNIINSHTTNLEAISNIILFVRKIYDVYNTEYVAKIIQGSAHTSQEWSAPTTTLKTTMDLYS